MRIFIVLLVVVGLLFVASLFVASGTQSGDPSAAFTSLSGRSIVQQITDRFATRLDPETLNDPHVQGRALVVPGGHTKVTLLIPASAEKYRRMEFSDVVQPVTLTYVDLMKDGDGNSQTQTWQWPVNVDNAKLSASEQGGLLTVQCGAGTTENCSLTFR
jgi:hypothetical protein